MKQGDGKNRLLTLLKVGLGLAILLALVLLGRLNIAALFAWGGETGKWAFMALGLVMAQPVVFAFRWSLLSRALGQPLSWWAGFRLVYVSMFFSTVMLGFWGGDLVRAYYAADRQPGQKMEAVSIVVLDRLLGLVSLCVLALGGLVYLGGGGWGYILPAILALVLIFAALFRADALARIKPLDRLLAKAGKRDWPQRLAGLMAVLKNRPGLLVFLILVGVACHLMAVLAIFLAGRFLGDQTGFMPYLAMVPATLIAAMAPLTPGGLGVTESVGEMVWLGYGSGLGADIMMLFRLQRTLAAVLLGLPFYLSFRSGEKPG